MLLAQWSAAAVSAVAKLNIADHLESGPKSTTELASLVGAHEDSLYRVMRALAGVGIFHEGKDRTFSNTPHSEVLRSDAPRSLRNLAAFMLDPWQYRSVGAIVETVKNGLPGVKNVFGMGLFEYLEAHPEEGALFNRGMTDMSTDDAPAVVGAYDFSGFGHIVDVAGGVGLLLGGILESAPTLRGTLFDVPTVIEQARSDGHLKSFEGRCELTSGSFFDGLPPGADAYIMKHIIHDWSDEHATTILKNCRSVLAPKGKLLVVDRVLGPPNEPDPKKVFDLGMMLEPGGRERTEAEFHGLFAASGFRVTKIVPTAGPLSIIEGEPA